MRFKAGLTLAALLAVSASPAWSREDAKRTLTIGLEAPRSISNVVMLMTVDRMRKAGHSVEVLDFNSPETLSLALQNGEVDLASTSAGTAFSAMDAGFEAKAFMGSARADFQMVARKELTSCQSLDGKRVGVQSREGTTGVLTQNWFATECPDARPNILIVPGSENRVAGLIAGQLDAAPVDLQNTAQLMQMRPDDFEIIASFSRSADLVGSVYYAATEWLQDNEGTVETFVATYVDVLEDAQQDPAGFKEKLHEILPDEERALLDRVAEGWLEQNIFIPVAGVQPDRIEHAIAFYGKVRPYRIIEDAGDVSTTDYLPTAD